MFNSTIIKNQFSARKVFFRIGSIVLLAVVALLSIKSARAQIIVTTNIVSQPLWGPVNYDYVDYYYLPQAGAYYYVPTNQFIYPNGGNWLFATILPPTYTIDLYRTYKVVLNTPTPYLQHVVYVKKYAKYKNVRSRQGAIRNSQNKKYFVVKGHPGAKVKATKPQHSKPAAVKVKSNKPAGVAKAKTSNGNGSKGKKGR